MNTKELTQSLLEEKLLADDLLHDVFRLTITSDIEFPQDFLVKLARYREHKAARLTQSILQDSIDKAEKNWLIKFMKRERRV